MPRFLLGLVGLVLLAVGLHSYVTLRALRRQQHAVRRRRGLVSAPTAQLLLEARGSVVRERWERFPAAARIIGLHDDCSDADLADALKALVAELHAEEGEMPVAGRESAFFAFYESGLAGLLEILERRRESAARIEP